MSLRPPVGGERKSNVVVKLQRRRAQINGKRKRSRMYCRIFPPLGLQSGLQADKGKNKHKNMFQQALHTNSEIAYAQTCGKQMPHETKIKRPQHKLKAQAHSLCLCWLR